MAFLLDSVVPWGRNIDEYKAMFLLNDEDKKKKIAGFGDGPASFNSQATKEGYFVKSFDIIYQFSKEQLEKRIEEVRLTVMQQIEENKDNYVWTTISNLKELETVRMSAMKEFLRDYEIGKSEERYIYYELPNQLPYENEEFDIGLSSHFLLMYTSLGYDFHIASINEMLRVCKEVRIFPICDLDGKSTKLIDDVMAYLSKKYSVEIKETEYEFQKGANRLLKIHR
ncbi:MAG: SAM-dependent methyltransferase [Lachnospiraceae bacterium]|nr:SAM-dependent methyltransferase [Lachnospiraceae bacterium]